MNGVWCNEKIIFAFIQRPDFSRDVRGLNIFTLIHRRIHEDDTLAQQIVDLAKRSINVDALNQ